MCVLSPVTHIQFRSSSWTLKSSLHDASSHNYWAIAMCGPRNYTTVMHGMCNIASSIHACALLNDRIFGYRSLPDINQLFRPCTIHLQDQLVTHSSDVTTRASRSIGMATCKLNMVHLPAWVMHDCGIISWSVHVKNPHHSIAWMGTHAATSTWCTDHLLQKLCDSSMYSCIDSHRGLSV